MRLWLKEADRRPDPAPVPTDDRAAIIVGTSLWVVALIIVAIVAPAEHRAWLLVTCGIGTGLGLLGLVYTQLRKR